MAPDAIAVPGNSRKYDQERNELLREFHFERINGRKVFPVKTCVTVLIINSVLSETVL